MTRSATLFDQGAEDEALRLATGMRVILHDSQASTSLLRHLGLTKTRMLSSWRGHGDWKDYLAQEINLSSSQPVRMRALLGSQFVELTFVNWWNNQSVFVHEGRQYSRRLICLSSANKDGGAHVDKNLEDYYKKLVSGEYMVGITGNLESPGPPFPQGVTIYPKNAHLALIRQFAHELLCSVEHFKWLSSP